MPEAILYIYTNTMRRILALTSWGEGKPMNSPKILATPAALAACARASNSVVSKDIDTCLVA